MHILSSCNMFFKLLHCRTIHPLVLDQNYITTKNQVIKAERRILKELGFCVHVQHPHKVYHLSIVHIFVYLWGMFIWTKLIIFCQTAEKANFCKCMEWLTWLLWSSQGFCVHWYLVVTLLRCFSGHCDVLASTWSWEKSETCAMCLVGIYFDIFFLPVLRVYLFLILSDIVIEYIWLFDIAHIHNALLVRSFQTMINIKGNIMLHLYFWKSVIKSL